MMEELQEAVRGAASSNRRCLWFVSVFCPLSARHFSSLLDEVMKWLLLLLHLLPLHLLTVLHQLARFFGAAVKLSRNGLWLDEDGEETSARVSDLLTQLKASISHFWRRDFGFIWSNVTLLAVFCISWCPVGLISAQKHVGCRLFG